MRARVVGYFRVRRVELTDRERETFVLVAQKRDAARLLLLHSERAEALRVALDAFHRARAIAPETLRPRVESAARMLDGVVLPETDRAFDATHARLLEGLLSVTLQVERELRDSTLSAAAARLRRVTRPLGALGAALVISAALYDLARIPPLLARASAISEPALGAANVVDDDLKTEWSLPPKVGGYVDVIPTALRTVHRVRLLNSKNLPSEQHGTRDFLVEVFVDGDVVGAFEDRFETFSRTPEWKTVEVGRTERVQRIRITVRSWFGDAGGLTEVVVE